VFYNLIENTVRYGDKPPKVRIDANPRGQCLMITYEDVGPGIPPEEKELIFQKGYGKGTGLGLFLSRNILLLTGIKIAETGEPGKGVRFEMCVPIDKHRYTASKDRGSKA
jgi:signal transduction histidine kinase